MKRSSSSLRLRESAAWEEIQTPVKLFEMICCARSLGDPSLFMHAAMHLVRLVSFHTLLQVAHLREQTDEVKPPLGAVAFPEALANLPQASERVVKMSAERALFLLTDPSLSTRAAAARAS